MQFRLSLLLDRSMRISNLQSYAVSVVIAIGTPQTVPLGSVSPLLLEQQWTTIVLL